jgi:acyl carrier protein
MDQNILHKVKTIIAAQIGAEESEIIDDAKLYEEVGVDSLDVVEITMALEEEFGHEIDSFPDEVVEKWVTVADIANWIEQNKE